MYSLSQNANELEQHPLISILLLILLLWFQGIFTALSLFNTSFLLNIYPLPILIFSMYLIIKACHLVYRLIIWSFKGFYLSYYFTHLEGESILRQLSDISQRLVKLQSQCKPNYKYFLYSIGIELVWLMIIDYKRPSLSLRHLTVSLQCLYLIFIQDTWQVMTEHTENFLRKAMFCNTVTFWLIVFWYRVFMDLEIQPKKKIRRTLSSVSTSLLNGFKKIFTNHRVSAETRQKLWYSLNTEFYRYFYFVKRFKKLNDLIWQDGFLIDFLQKKIVDKWLRGFVIYSANLFSERLLFDRVVRFYIDFIFRSISSLTVYEYNSASSVLLINLQLLILTSLLVILLFITSLLL
jgi:hypothetical protein